MEVRCSAIPCAQQCCCKTSVGNTQTRCAGTRCRIPHNSSVLFLLFVALFSFVLSVIALVLHLSTRTTNNAHSSFFMLCAYTQWSFTLSLSLLRNITNHPSTLISIQIVFPLSLGRSSCSFFFLHNATNNQCCFLSFTCLSTTEAPHAAVRHNRNCFFLVLLQTSLVHYA